MKFQKYIWAVLLTTTFVAAIYATLSSAKESKHKTHCDDIPWSDYQTGMIFNPPDQQAVYRRSQCLQTLAISLRDDTICTEVREYKSIFFDGSGVSPASCSELVKRKVARDISEANKLGSFHQLKQVLFALNGNGRDFDIRIVTVGEAYNRYQLAIDLEEMDGTVVGCIYEDIQMVGKGGGNIVLFLRRTQLLELVADRGLERIYQAVVTLQPAIDSHNRYILRHIDEEKQRSTLTTSVNFSSLTRMTGW